MKSNWSYITPGIPDKAFIRGKVPMTKEEVRTITMGKLRLKKNHIIVDIGAGTGSISIEAALISSEGMVYAVERNDEGVNLIKKNTKNFSIENIKVVKGHAPEALDFVPKVDRAILGGTGRKMTEIFDWLDDHLKVDGRVVMNAITIENVYKGIECLKKRNYKNIDVTQAFISKGKEIANLTMMIGGNPIYIISADKGEI